MCLRHAVVRGVSHTHTHLITYIKELKAWDRIFSCYILEGLLHFDLECSCRVLVQIYPVRHSFRHCVVPHRLHKAITLRISFVK